MLFGGLLRAKNRAPDRGHCYREKENHNIYIYNIYILYIYIHYIIYYNIYIYIHYTYVMYIYIYIFLQTYTRYIVNERERYIYIHTHMLESHKVLVYETPDHFRELPLRDYILPEAGSRSRLHGVRSRMPCRSWCLAVIIRESAAQLCGFHMVPLSPMKCAGNFMEFLDHWIQIWLHQPLCGANPLHFQIFSVPLGSSQIQRWHLRSRGDKLEELEEEIRKQGGWECCVFLHILQVWWWKSPPIGNHILGPRYVFEMMGFDLICKIPQIQTHYDFNYDYDSHWQKVFFFFRDLYRPCRLFSE